MEVDSRFYLIYYRNRLKFRTINLRGCYFGSVLRGRVSVHILGPKGSSKYWSVSEYFVMCQ